MPARIPTKLKRHFEGRRGFNASLPVLEKNLLKWVEQARQTVGYTTRNFDLSPFWYQIYEDNHPNIMVVAGRQTFKTTFCSDILANAATSRPRSEVCYVSDSEAHLSAFSKQRFRIETFQQNPMLRQFLRYDRGNIGEISLGNDSTVRLVTDEGEYKKVEGQSLQLLVLDEAQYQDVQFLTKALYALFQTHGRVFVLGIGGEAGSEYYKMWHKTDQREWIYDDKFWYEKIIRDTSGNISNDSDDLKKILAGRWVAQKPENTQFRGYHLPQTIFPIIPRTIEECQLHNINPQFSIEYQRRYSPASYFISHCLGDFYKAERRPITPEMVEACYNRYLTLLTLADIAELKQTFGDQIRVLGGIDFGSSTVRPTTVASIVIHWRKPRRFQLAFIEKIPQSDHPFDKAKRAVEIFRVCDTSVGDLGHGQDLIPIIQQGGRDSQDRLFEGLGKRRFIGCRTIGDETKPEQLFKVDVADDGRKQLGRLQIDKTTVIQNFIDFIGAYIAHPRRLEDQCKRTTFLIPMKNDWECDWLLDDFCSITRKDLEQDPDAAKEDPRQHAKKEFNHPPDSVMSLIYTQVADKHFDEGAFRIS